MLEVLRFSVMIFRTKQAYQRPSQNKKAAHTATDIIRSCMGCFFVWHLSNRLPKEIGYQK